MDRKISQTQYSTLPQEQLRFLSMTEDINDKYSNGRGRIGKQEIQPWMNQHENPSQSPQRRTFAPRPAPASTKIEKALQIKLLKTPTKVLQSNNNSNLSFRVKQNRPKTPTKPQKKIQEENKPITRATPIRRRYSFQKTNYTSYIEQGSENEQKAIFFHTKVNPIVYPLVLENRKKRLFRKMDKFQNFVSVSLRK